MSNPYVGEIRMVPYNFTPQGWAACDGSLIPISQNDALFSLLGTTYGGDGQNTFGLPDLRGRVPVHYGQSFSVYSLGQMGGVENVTLSGAQLPVHTHAVDCLDAPGTAGDPTGNFVAQPSENLYTTAGSPVAMAPATSTTGGGAPHNNLQPSLAIMYIISLYGIYPSQT